MTNIGYFWRISGSLSQTSIIEFLVWRLEKHINFLLLLFVAVQFFSCLLYHCYVLLVVNCLTVFSVICFRQLLRFGSQTYWELNIGPCMQDFEYMYILGCLLIVKPYICYKHCFSVLGNSFFLLSLKVEMWLFLSI